MLPSAFASPSAASVDYADEFLGRLSVISTAPSCNVGNNNNNNEKLLLLSLSSRPPSLSLILFSSSTFLLFLPACFSFSAMHFGQVRVKGSHSVYVASTCALPLPLQRTVALIANNNNNDNRNNLQQQQQRQPHRQAAAAGDVAVAQAAIVTEINSANSVERERRECCTNSLTVEECLS